METAFLRGLCDARQSPCAQMSAEGCAEFHWLPVPAQLAMPGILGELPVPLIVLGAPKLVAMLLYFTVTPSRCCLRSSLCALQPAGCLQALWPGYLLLFLGLVHS